jgi:hypothetical protein
MTARTFRGTEEYPSKCNTFRALFGCSTDLDVIAPSDGENAPFFRKKRVEVTDFST